MAFPDNYRENTSPCIKKGWNHEWIGNNHPITHKCKWCHKPKYVEVKEEYVTNPAKFQL